MSTASTPPTPPSPREVAPNAAPPGDDGNPATGGVPPDPNTSGPHQTSKIIPPEPNTSGPHQHAE